MSNVPDINVILAQMAEMQKQLNDLQSLKKDVKEIKEISSIGEDIAKEVAEENHAQLLITTLQKGKIKYYNTASFNKYWTPFNIINQ